MNGDDAFERALHALLSGEPIDRAIDVSADEALPLEALRVLSAIGQTSHAVLFGGSPKERGAATTWGHLEIREEIGRGSSGTVYRAWDTRLAREVALKLIDPESAVADAALSEGRLLARVRHPNIVTVYGVDTCDGVAGLWMELVEGDPLDDVVQRDGACSIEDALLVGIDLASALAAIHAAGMLHRDVKARNVVRQRGGRLVLMDLGAGQGADRLASASDGVGTPLYMAPEVLAGAPASVQNDIYGLGVLLHYLVTGTYPVTAPDLASLRAAHRAGTRRLFSEGDPNVPPAARAAIERACSPDPAARYETAQHLEGALTEALADVLASRARVVPASTRRWRRWRRATLTTTAAAIALAVIVAAGWNSTPGRSARRAMGLPVPPRSPLYFTFGGGIGVIDGAKVRFFAHGKQGAIALAASERHGVRVMAGKPPSMGDAWFGLDGTPMLPAATSEPALCCYYDGTTDGRFNYALRQDSTLLDPIGSRPLAPPAIHQFDLDWRNGELVFEIGESVPGVTSRVYYGIAYAGASHTFWVTRQDPDGTASAEQWSRDGRRRATFALAPHSTGIAVDPADGTIWVVRDEANESAIHFDNLDTSGRPLGTFSVTRPVAGVGVSGVEHAWPAIE